FNAKHPWWGNQRTCSRGKSLQEAVLSGAYQILASGEPTFYSDNTQNNPSAIDFYVVNGISYDNLSIKTHYELSSDHLPLVATLHQSVQRKPKRHSILSPGSCILA
ncbi:hypothetical protein KR044_009989, partial [Drosophila immigrans]